MLNIIKKAGIINRANDEILYEYVLEEMEQGVRIKGLWAKALAHSDGMESKAESMYMQYRVQSIKDQFDALKIAYDEMSRKRLFDYIKNGFKEPVPEVKKIEEVKKVEKVKKAQTVNVIDEENKKTLKELKEYHNKYYNSFEFAKRQWKSEGSKIDDNEPRRSFGEFLKILSIFLFPLLLVIAIGVISALVK